MLYQHTQRGVLMLTVLLAGALVPAAVIWFSGNWSAAAVLIILVVTAFLFSSLSVEVDPKEVRWHFGPGLLRYHVAREEIQSVAVVRNTWWNGFGIRMRPGFRLYNVSGLDAVELRLKSGEVRRIGTDDPQGLAGALRG